MKKIYDSLNYEGIYAFVEMFQIDYDRGKIKTIYITIMRKRSS